MPEKIKNLLFPDPILEKNESNENVLVDSSLDSNIAAVIADIEEGFADELTLANLHGILKVLVEVRNILKAEMVIKEDWVFDYLIVRPPVI